MVLVSFEINNWDTNGFGLDCDELYSTYLINCILFEIVVVIIRIHSNLL